MAFSNSSLTISHVSSGNLSTILSNPSYESRTVDAGIRDWRAGQWHHVALQWKLDDGGKTAVALHIDGRLASDRCMGNTKNGKPTFLLGISYYAARAVPGETEVVGCRV